MKEKILALVIGLITLSMVVVPFVSCMANANNQPSIDDIEQFIGDHYSNITTISNYLIDLDYDVYIDDDSGEILADLEYIKLDNEEIVKIIDKLMDDQLISIFKKENTINFLMWSSYREISCGFAYSINGVDQPDVQYMTELEPLSYDGWYYYVADYNKWRANRQ